MLGKNRDPTLTAGAGIEPKAVTYAEFAGVRRSEGSAEQEQINACFYGRYSCDAQSAATIVSQRKAVMKYIETSAVPIRCVMEYVDEALSGKSDARPAFRRMISDAKTGLFKVILCYKQDRISRNLGDFMHYKSLLEDDYGVNIIAVEGGFDDDTPEGWMGNSINMVLSEYYIRNLRRETIRGLTENARNARHCGGSACLGYKIDPVTKKYVLDSDETKVDSVRKIFQWTAEGWTYKQIAATLNAMGRTNARGRPFKPVFHETLKQRRYIGEFCWGLLPAGSKTKKGRHIGRRYRVETMDESQYIKVPNGCPRIISDELFYKVADILKRKQRTRPLIDRKYLLSGLLRCECGYAFAGSYKRTRKGSPLYYFYQCCSRGDRQCGNHTISMAMLNEFAVESIRDFVRDPKKIQRLINESLEAGDKEQRVALKEIQATVREIADKTRKQNMLDWQQTAARLIKEIRISHEQVEMYLRLNAFFTFERANWTEELLCVFTKDRNSLRKFAKYKRLQTKPVPVIDGTETQKNIKETTKNEIQENE